LTHIFAVTTADRIQRNRGIANVLVSVHGRSVAEKLRSVFRRVSDKKLESRRFESSSDKGCAEDGRM